MAESMRELEFDFDTLGSRIIPLGYQGESMRLQISIDCSAALTTYSAESAALIITAPDGTSYPGDVWEQDGVLLWQVTDTDTAIAGNGSIRVDLVDAGGVTVHSAGAMTVILEENAREVDNLRAIQEKVGTLLACCDSVNATLTDLGGRMEEAEDGLDDVNSVITDKDVEWTTALDSARARLTAIEEILHDLQEEVAALEGGESGSIATLIADMEAAQAAIDDLEEGTSGISETISTLQTTVTGVQSSISTINSSISTINGKLVFESTPTADSNKLIRSKDLKTLFDAKVAKAGDTMTGPLTVPSTSTSDGAGGIKIKGGNYPRLSFFNSSNAVLADFIAKAADGRIYFREFDPSNSSNKEAYYLPERSTTGDKTYSILTTKGLDASPTSGSDNPVKSGGVYTALAGKQATLEYDTTPTAGSNKLIKSKDLKTLFDAKMDTKTIDSAPTSGHSTQLVTSGGVYTALAGKQDTLSYDTTPTAGSNKLIKSKDLKTLFDAKMDTKTIDSAPTSGHSTQLVTSGGVYTAINNNEAKTKTLTYTISGRSGYSNKAVRYANGMVTVQYVSNDVTGEQLGNGVTLFTLPSDCRPSAPVYVTGSYVYYTNIDSVSGGNSPIYCKVNTNGTVQTIRYDSKSDTSKYAILLCFTFTTL